VYSIAGIDLAGKEKNPTGVCILSGSIMKEITTLYTDEEILHFTQSYSR